MTISQNTEKKKSGVFGKILAWLLIIVFLTVGGFLYYKYYFVFGEGVKSGYLNFAVKKGNLFKTYEGKIIQDGLRAQTGSGLSSNEFEISIDNYSIFKILELKSGKYVDLHYKEYHGVLPWRCNTRYVVDQVSNMK